MLKIISYWGHANQRHGVIPHLLGRPPFEFRCVGSQAVRSVWLTSSWGFPGVGPPLFSTHGFHPGTPLTHLPLTCVTYLFGWSVWSPGRGGKGEEITKVNLVNDGSRPCGPGSPGTRMGIGVRLVPPSHLQCHQGSLGTRRRGRVKSEHEPARFKGLRSDRN